MSKNVLICDDDPGILDVVKIVLYEKGYHVVAVKNGEELNRALQESHPDLILLDLWMPGISGEVVTKKLKKDDKTKHIPIIVVSARTDTEETAIKSGADGFLLKPFDIEHLETIVEKHLH